MNNLHVSMLTPHEWSTVNAQIFIGDYFSWASFPTKIKPTKICTH